MCRRGTHARKGGKRAAKHISSQNATWAGQYVTESAHRTRLGNHDTLHAAGEMGNGRGFVKKAGAADQWQTGLHCTLLFSGQPSVNSSAFVLVFCMI